MDSYCLLICLSIWAVERKCAAEGLKAGSVSCGTCAGQDPLFKPCRAPAHLRHIAEEHKAVSQAGSLFRSMLHAFHGGNLTITSEDIGFTLRLIWSNCRLPWKGWPRSILPLATCSCCFLWVISIDYGAAEQANGKLTCQKQQNPRSFPLGQLMEAHAPGPIAGSSPWEGQEACCCESGSAVGPFWVAAAHP